MTSFQLIATADGSLTLKDAESGELFHNSAGAYSEALINYVLPSGILSALSEGSSVEVLDVCFGLGYNSYVLIEEALKKPCAGRLRITAIEPNPNLLSLTDKVLSFEKFEHLRAQGQFADQLSTQGRTKLSAGSLEIELNFVTGSIEKVLPILEHDFDFIFHDPFSPKRAPELWTAEIFQKYFMLLQARKGAILTYSTATAVRGALIEAGFVVKRTAGLGAKTGGSLGFIDPSKYQFLFDELDENETKRLSTVSGIPYRSMGFSLDRADILRRRIDEQSRVRASIKD